MNNVFEGHLNAQNHKFAIVAGRFNSLITEKLIAGAEDALKRHGGSPENLDLVWVPGAFEIPLMAKECALRGEYQGIICLGAIIKGHTPHFDYVAAEAAKGIGHVSLETGVPVIFGVLTVDTIEQAIERAGTKAGNKGFEAMATAIEMVDLQMKLRNSK